MNIGKVYAIFRQIESAQYTEDEKAEAIYRVLLMSTHNSITKTEMLTVIKYLFNHLWEVEADEKQPAQA